MKSLYRIAFVAFILLFTLPACKKESTPPMPTSYLAKWYGSYHGTSHKWTSYPQGSTFVTTHWYKDVLVDVQKGSTDSTLNFAFTYDDTILSSRNDITFSENYAHNSQWGWGSSYGSLDVQFSNDTVLTYNLFQKCGIPCSSGEDFVIFKK